MIMYKRLELHNHTIESDGNLTPSELIDLMCDDKVDAFALTDHNTISGHIKIQEALAQKNIPLSCIYGMEYTTYYGHILCFDLKEYIPWENINLHNPELLFKAIKEKGALAGIAHPFSYGYPIGCCRFEMTFTDYSCLDFIEIFNNPEPLHEVNEQGLLWWESLILEGHRIAFTSGMDLHSKDSMHGQFATFIEGKENGNIITELKQAIHTQRTWVSKGPLLVIEKNDYTKTLYISIQDTTKPGYVEDDRPYLLSLRTKKETLCFSFNHKAPLIIPYSNLNSSSILIPKLYKDNLEIENLIAVAPVIYL